MMTYIDRGFNLFLTREIIEPPQEMMEVDTAFTTNTVIGSKIGKGITTSASGRIKINWDTGTITFNNGADDYMLMGFQKNGF